MFSRFTIDDLDYKLTWSVETKGQVWYTVEAYQMIGDELGPRFSSTGTSIEGTVQHLVSLVKHADSK